MTDRDRILKHARDDAFAIRIRDHMAEAEIIHQGLWDEGPALIAECQDVGYPPGQYRSLRELARIIGVSPTYLSRIRHRREIVSMKTYLRLSDFLLDTEACHAAQPRAADSK